MLLEELNLGIHVGHIGQAALRNAVEAISSPAPSAPAKDAENLSGSFDNPFGLNRKAEGNIPKL
jgi:hypothetical protein